MTDIYDRTDLSPLFRPAYSFSINGVPAKVVKINGDVVTIEATINPNIIYFNEKKLWIS